MSHLATNYHDKALQGIQQDPGLFNNSKHNYAQRLMRFLELLQHIKPGAHLRCDNEINLAHHCCRFGLLLWFSSPCSKHICMWMVTASAMYMCYCSWNAQRFPGWLTWVWSVNKSICFIWWRNLMVLGDMQHGVNNVSRYTQGSSHWTENKRKWYSIFDCTTMQCSEAYASSHLVFSSPLCTLGRMTFASECTTTVNRVRQSLRHYNLLVLKKANAQSHANFWCLCHQSGITRSVLTVTISA